MFKNITIYRIALVDGPNEAESHQFVPCGASQAKSMGWAPVRNQAHGALIEVIAEQRILRMMTETRAVPKSAVDKHAALEAEKIELLTGRKPGKKETRELRENALLALLPMAFSKESGALVWIDQKNGLMVIDSASQSRCDDAVTLIVKSFPGVSMQMINTKVSPASAMASWLVDADAVPSHFTVDRECELKASDESKAVVKYGRHALDIEEVKNHITSGKMPTKLALTWKDRVSFVLTEAMTLKKVEMLDVIFENNKDANSHADAFDSDIAIATGELAALIADLIPALGGEVFQPTGEQA